MIFQCRDAPFAKARCVICTVWCYHRYLTNVYEMNWILFTTNRVTRWGSFNINCHFINITNPTVKISRSYDSFISRIRSCILVRRHISNMETASYWGEIKTLTFQKHVTTNEHVSLSSDGEAIISHRYSLITSKSITHLGIFGIDTNMCT